MFLISVQDTVRSDIEGGALENVLFLGGRFRGFLSAKSLVLAVAVAGYAAGSSVSSRFGAGRRRLRSGLRRAFSCSACSRGPITSSWPGS